MFTFCKHHCDILQASHFDIIVEQKKNFQPSKKTSQNIPEMFVLSKKLLSGSIFVTLRFIMQVLGAIVDLMYINSPRIPPKPIIFPL